MRREELRWAPHPSRPVPAPPGTPECPVLAWACGWGPACRRGLQATWGDHTETALGTTVGMARSEPHWLWDSGENPGPCTKRPPSQPQSPQAEGSPGPGSGGSGVTGRQGAFRSLRLTSPVAPPRPIIEGGLGAGAMIRARTHRVPPLLSPGFANDQSWLPSLPPRCVTWELTQPPTPACGPSSLKWGGGSSPVSVGHRICLTVHGASVGWLGSSERPGVELEVSHKLL